MEYTCKHNPSHQGHCDKCWQNDSAQTISRNFFGHTEPEQLYRLFFAKAAARRWSQLMRGWNPPVQYGGVFTHQRPYVTFSPGTVKSSVTCELADLLIVFTNQVTQQRGALLLQAKRGTKWIPSNRKQWTLFTQWPAITYTMGARNYTRTMPFAKSEDAGAQYMMLQKPKVDVSCAKPIYSPHGLGVAVKEMVHGRTGRAFSFDRSSASNEWDHLIWDLIENTDGESASKYISVPRRAGVLSPSCLKNVVEAEPPDTPTGKRVTNEEDNEDFGIPIVHFASGLGEVEHPDG
jgi:hypothetical protein